MFKVIQFSGVEDFQTWVLAQDAETMHIINAFTHGTVIIVLFVADVPAAVLEFPRPGGNPIPTPNPYPRSAEEPVSQDKPTGADPNAPAVVGADPGTEASDTPAEDKPTGADPNAENVPDSGVPPAAA